jgi:hypothetical protein
MVTGTFCVQDLRVWLFLLATNMWNSCIRKVEEGYLEQKIDVFWECHDGGSVSPGISKIIVILSSG